MVQSISRLQKTRLSQKAMNQTGFLKLLRLISAFQNYKGPFPFQRGTVVQRDSSYREKTEKKQSKGCGCWLNGLSLMGEWIFATQKRRNVLKSKGPFCLKIETQPLCQLYSIVSSLFNSPSIQYMVYRCVYLPSQPVDVCVSNFHTIHEPYGI